MEYGDNIGIIIFIVVYFSIIWSALGKLALINLKQLPWKKRTASWKWLFIAYLLLASGDMFHLGLRIGLHALGYDQTGDFANFIYGVGYIASGLTMTYFYVAVLHAMIDIYGRHFPETLTRRYLTIAYAAFFVRIILVSLPYNHWFSGIGLEVSGVDFGFDFRILSALPIFIVGITTLVYTFKAVGKEMARPAGVDPMVNKANLGAAWWYIVSYLCYGIAVMFIASYSIVGFLYAPKTIAYLMALYFHFRYILNSPVKVVSPENRNSKDLLFSTRTEKMEGQA